MIQLSVSVRVVVKTPNILWYFHASSSIEIAGMRHIPGIETGIALVWGWYYLMPLPGCYWCKGSIASHQNSLVDLFPYIPIQLCFDLHADFGLLCWGHFGAEKDEPDSCNTSCCQRGPKISCWLAFIMTSSLGSTSPRKGYFFSEILI